MRFMKGLDPIRARVYPHVSRIGPFREGPGVLADAISRYVSKGRVLDVGCGPGFLAVEIAERIPGVEVVGLDITPRLVEFATRHAEKRGVADRVRFVHGDAEDLPFEDAEFDFAASTGAFHHFEDPTLCLKEIHRVLRDGAFACIGEVMWDVMSPEVNALLRKQHGRVKARLMQLVASPHSMSKAEVDVILNSIDEIGFKDRELLTFPERLSFLIGFRK